MKGLTNAQIGGGSGGSSLIYAYDGSGQGFAIGEKAFIKNKLVTEEYSAQLSYAEVICYPYGNYLVTVYNNTADIHTYNGTGFSSRSFPSTYVYNRNLIYIDGQLHGYDYESTCLLNDHPQGFYYDSGDGVYNPTTFYLGNNLALHKSAGNSDLSLVECDEEALTVGQTYYTFTGYDKTFTRKGFLCGNRLLYWASSNSGGNYVATIYDISTKTAPVQLGQGTMSQKPYCPLGLNVGDIILASSSDYNVDEDGVTLSVYRIDENNQIQPESIPDILAPYAGNCLFVYNPNNHILNLGTKNGVYFFLYDEENKTFSRFNVEVDELPDTNGYVYLPIIADDFSKLGIVYGRSTYARYAQGYILKNDDGNLYAYKSPNGLGEEYVTGFATGETEDNKLEFEGALPELTLTVNVTPDADSLTIVGGAE